jgi:NADH-quinone oxidoreductase subunit N
MNTVAVLAEVKGPHIDWAGLSPLLAPIGGALVVLMVGLLPGRATQRVLVPVLTLITLAIGIAFCVWQWEPGDRGTLVSGALTDDTLALGIAVLVFVAGIATVLLAWRSTVIDEAGGGEFYALLLSSIAGMVMLAAAENLIVLFIAFELLSIPLYVLCASRVRREASLESGLKYLIVGSVGSATLLYGLAFIYGATGSTDFSGISEAIAGTVGIGDPLMLIGIAFIATGLAFKASVAPFHTWTPDVYQGAPTPVTAFMAVATKAAAFGIFLRLFFDALGSAQTNWAPALAALATITIVIGNVGALAQRSMKRLLAWSSVGQAGYLLAGVVVGNELGLQATVFYLAVYLLMNVAAFAVVIARERVDDRGDDIEALQDLGRASPWLAWPMTIAMLSLAGIPGTVGFIGKFQLIHALVNGNYTWLAIVLVIGSMISLGYYLRVVATLWMRDEVPAPAPEARASMLGRPGLAPIAGGSPEADDEDRTATIVAAPLASATAVAGIAPEVTAVAVLFAAASVVFGVFPSPLFNLAAHAGQALGLF